MVYHVHAHYTHQVLWRKAENATLIRGRVQSSLRFEVQCSDCRIARLVFVVVLRCRVCIDSLCERELRRPNTIAEYVLTLCVNEKCDVYIFGMVLLELTTGHEANKGKRVKCLAKWVWRHFQDGKDIMMVLDEDIREGALGVYL